VKPISRWVLKTRCTRFSDMSIPLAGLGNRTGRLDIYETM
jgi:hypothetical protein